jgi:hypothetical protein
MSNHLVYLSLGTNLGNKEENLQNALKLLEEQVGNIVSQSALYASSPGGFVSENSFLNCVIAINTTFSPQELLSITQHIELSLGRTHKTINGQYDKVPLPCEGESRKQARRSIVANTCIKEGTLITADMLTCKRPGTGISPTEMDNVIGKKSKIDIAEDELLKYEYLE